MNDLTTALWGCLQVIIAYSGSGERTTECEGVDALLSQLTVSVDSDSSVYVFLSQEKQRTFGCTWCFVCDGVRAPSQTSQRPLLVPVWGQTLAFHWKNTVVYSDKNRASHSSLHDITGPEPCLISFINLWQFLLCKTRHIYEILPKENCRCTTNYSPEMLLSLGTFQVSSSYPLALKYI